MTQDEEKVVQQIMSFNLYGQYQPGVQIPGFGVMSVPKPVPFQVPDVSNLNPGEFPWSQQSS